MRMNPVSSLFVQAVRVERQVEEEHHEIELTVESREGGGKAQRVNFVGPAAYRRFCMGRENVSCCPSSRMNWSKFCGHKPDPRHSFPSRSTGRKVNPTVRRCCASFKSIRSRAACCMRISSKSPWISRSA